MTSKSLPPALEPYLRLPPETSLVLLTSTLGCSGNWLTARFIGSALASEDQSSAIVLVSWIRELNFWKNEFRRTSGIDMAKLSQTGQFAFVDCFSSSPSLEEIRKNVQRTTTSNKKVLLVLDNPDILLATTSTTSLELQTFLMTLRSEPHVHATVLAVSADLPNVSAAVSETKSPIEAETAAFTTAQAHASRWVLAVRELETGAAKDVSGVLRITRGGNSFGWDQEDHEVAKEAELLYLVQRDGTVKVFGRGVDVN